MMKLVNQKAPGIKLALPTGTIQADEHGVVDVPEEFVTALLRSGYVKIEDLAKVESKAAPKPDVSRIASHALRVKEEMLAKQAEAPKKQEVKPEPAQQESAPAEVKAEEAAPLAEEGAEKETPKRGWKRGK